MDSVTVTYWKLLKQPDARPAVLGTQQANELFVCDISVCMLICKTDKLGRLSADFSKRCLHCVQPAYAVAVNPKNLFMLHAFPCWRSHSIPALSHLFHISVFLNLSDSGVHLLCCT